MRREYNLKNKINFIVIGVLSVLIIIIFSLFIVKFISIKKIEYSLDKGIIIFDVDKNRVSIDKNTIMKLKWNGNYYLDYSDNEVILGRRVIAYNEFTKTVDLYGKFYEINDNGEVNITKDVNSINTQGDSKFYKLEDRKYLLIDRVIKSSDGAMDTSNYLIVELDKQGNALLLNNEVHYKTLSEAIINTSSYSFDVANEILKFGDNVIDLKEIIGSSNLYKPNDNSDDEGSSNDNNMGGNSGISIGGNAGNGGTATGDNGVVNNGEDGEDVIDDIVVKNKKTSILSVNPSVDSISVDYLVYDPNDEYKTIYVEVRDGDSINTVYLSKSNTNVILNDLKINTKYNLKFMYSYLDDTGKIVVDSFNEINVSTSYPSYQISLVKLSKVSNELSYRVSIDNRYIIDKINVSLIIDDEIIDSKSVNVGLNNGVNPKNVTDSFILPNINKGSVVVIRLDSVSSNGMVIKTNSYYKYINE